MTDRPKPKKIRVAEAVLDPGQNFRDAQYNDLLTAIRRRRQELADELMPDDAAYVFRDDNFRLLRAAHTPEHMKATFHRAVVVQVECEWPRGKFIIGWDQPLVHAMQGPYDIHFFPHRNQQYEKDMGVRWYEVMKHYDEWLAALEQESQPNLWDEAEQKRQVVDASWEYVKDEEDRAFTVEEIQSLTTGFQNAAKEIEQKRLLSPEDQRELVEAFKVHAASAKDEKVKQWSERFLIWWGNWAVHKFASSELAQQAWTIIGNNIGHVWHGLVSVGHHITGFLPPV